MILPRIGREHAYALIDWGYPVGSPCRRRQLHRRLQNEQLGSGQLGGEDLPLPLGHRQDIAGRGGAMGLTQIGTGFPPAVIRIRSRITRRATA